MRIKYKDLVQHINKNPSVKTLSENLFQLGHEHEINNDIFDIEFTPNRGDCLSVMGLLRDLSIFYKINTKRKIYEKAIDTFPINFINNQEKLCTNISFLKVEIEGKISSYKGDLKSYFDDPGIKKINFFTDISNYISYETGQPTHCYDAKKIGNNIKLDIVNGNFEFNTLLEKKIELSGKNLVFLQEKEIINLAGIVGGMRTACSNETRSVIIECAYFNPELIIGKSVKYDIQSDAAYKFERGVDPACHDYVLRRFLKIIQEHAAIKNVEIFQKEYLENENKLIQIDADNINKILGTNIDTNDLESYLSKLGFKFTDNIAEVPSYRSDVRSKNDIAEEIARSIGYDNIIAKQINIPHIKNDILIKKESAVKSLLIDNGFYEVINNPFVSTKDKMSIKVDNPLDSNRDFIRTSLKQSLIDNLIYNERRQKDSVKIFEISSLHSLSNPFNYKKTLAILASGRVDKNYIDFTKKINVDYIEDIIGEYIGKNKIKSIPRNNIDSKSKNEICYIEIDLDELDEKIITYNRLNNPTKEFNKYIAISDYPSSSRDLSFSISDFSKLKPFEKHILNFNDELLREVFVFDYFVNKTNQEIKIGFRFIFQSSNSTITDSQVDNVMNKICYDIREFDGVSLPGMNKI